MNKKYTGRCLCGGVTYEARGAPRIVAQCHCEECRRLSGTGHTVGAMFDAASVTFSGRMTKFKYMSGTSSEVTRAFCGVCGSPVYGANTRLPDHLTLTLGTMDDADDLEIAVVIYRRGKPHWDRHRDDIATFETQPEWTPSD